MVSRRRTAQDPPASHFRIEERSATLSKDGADYLADANFYRRRIEDAGPRGEGRIGTRWFVGARSGFMMGFHDGVSVVRRTPDDIAADGIDGVIVNLVLAGHLRVMADDRDETFEAGALFMEDTTHPREAINWFVRSATVFIPRDRVAAGWGPPAAALMLRRLSTTGLGGIVAQQIRRLSEVIDTLAPEEFEVLLDGTIDAALVMLRRAAAADAGAVDPILLAAKAYIEANFREPRLTPETIARGVGCSRTVLYRSFTSTGLTVASHLREVRFRHFLTALRAHPTAPAARLAYDCGFAAASSDFNKLFRRTYGITPREARARLLAQPTSDDEAEAGA